ncbi:chemotaxis protein CheX [Desulforhabdus amnigena]|jgi:hypothetical protein|uniref:Chemotaxis phosphatase CheX-like domain-containing protein n=1 Tax=Desulforhabdus amnigena TaxID=40218 RepID=A0A9W6FTC5_9BACT|nr:chemotaxis protein CheX [Desulforhabdus amnigena]NLJ27645.1 chemotaxis protein CheX [Deltaproteobacteria bacterium]GLI33545.1 hypothetical protein DAMNIGENAA_09780 [Desulforhabdus amnigena]
MKDAISEVLETMFFVMVDFPPAEKKTNQSYCESRIYLRQNRKRLEIGLQLGEGFAKMLTANLLGKHELEVNADELQDAMKELANMVGGSYLARLADGNWQLGIPQFVSMLKEERTFPAQISLSFFGEYVGEVHLSSEVSG